MYYLTLTIIKMLKPRHLSTNHAQSKGQVVDLIKGRYHASQRESNQQKKTGKLTRAEDT